jgi:hypothetical protein
LVPFHLRVNGKASTVKAAETTAGAASPRPKVAVHPLGLSPVHGAAAESLRAAKATSAEAAALCETAEAAVSRAAAFTRLPRFCLLGLRAAIWCMGES